METKVQKNRAIRIAEIRKNLVEMDKKEREYRQDNIDKREYRGYDRDIKDFLLAYNGKRKRQEVKGDYGSLSAIKGSAKGSKRVSRGPKLSKKEKSLRELTMKELEESGM